MTRIYQNLMVFFLLLLCSGESAAHNGSPVKPITGTWINLAYQDVRNKYTNPPYIDNTAPYLWEAKVEELAQMGMEYLVFMAVANEEKAFYPSKLMQWAFPANRKSPVDAIMDAAAKRNMKVFMSTGWAKNQDDNLRDPAIKQRQLEMIKELAGLYGKHPALYGWYLPVEDCLCPLLSDHAATAVNALTEQIHTLTPGKKILISPYGIFNSDFANPEYEKQLAKLKVDIIAYQDEVGCVREKFPLVHLKENWKKLRAIHDKLHIAMWANCETFTWEKAANDRTSALIPAAYSRLLSQQAAASAAGVEQIISFMFCGIIESPESPYQLGQPMWSNYTYRDYMAWKKGNRYWKLLEASFLNKLANTTNFAKVSGAGASSPLLLDGAVGEENMADAHWTVFKKGFHELIIGLQKETTVHDILLRMLNYRSADIGLPTKIHLSTSQDGNTYHLLSTKEISPFLNSNHDAWIEGAFWEKLNIKKRFLKITFDASSQVYIDEIFINPSVVQ